MSFSFFKKAASVKMAETSARSNPSTPVATPRIARLGRKTQVLALAAHIGQAGQRSRIGLPHWGG